LQLRAHSWKKSLVLWEELGDRKAFARSLSNLANVTKLAGRLYCRARSLYAECFSIFRGLGDRTGTGLVAQIMRETSRATRGDSEAPGNCSEQSLEIFRESSVDAAGGLQARWLSGGGLARGTAGIAAQHIRCTGKACRIFAGAGNDSAEVPLSWLECFCTAQAAGQHQSERSLLDWRGAGGCVAPEYRRSTHVRGAGQAGGHAGSGTTGIKRYVRHNCMA